MKNSVRWFGIAAGILVGLIVTGLAIGAIVVAMALPRLPSLEVLIDYRPKVPLRIYSADGHLISEFGEERRAVVRIQEVPVVMKQAILAAEDERFYAHGGVDTLGVLRAAIANLSGGGKRQGASTITMQVARNFFLSSEKTLTRKLYEALLSFKIESNLSKDQIFEIYMNQIFLGQRAYGFAAAAQIYFGKALKDITPAEAAMLAGLPKAPSAYNPVVNPKRARLRQEYVLRRMHELEFINTQTYEAALKQELVVKRDASDFGVHAEYVAEMARQMAFERFGEEAYTGGYRVITTINKGEQEAAYLALRRGVLDYDRRHGYRGPESHIDIDAAIKAMGSKPTSAEELYDEILQDANDLDNLHPALVLSIDAKAVKVYRRDGSVIEITGDGLKFVAKWLDPKAPTNRQLRRGSIVRVSNGDKGWSISQIPEVQAAMVLASPQDGAIRALVGGFDFNGNKFNHVTQAWRQPGSSFKPFIYSAALEKGFHPGSIIDDSPIVIDGAETGGGAWEPKNYDGKYEGPMPMRTALAKSKNMVSIRLLQAVTPPFAQDYAGRFGLDPAKHPPYLTMALGAGMVTPWQMARAYAVFANGGYLVNPYIVREIQDTRGHVVARAQPVQAGDESVRAIDARNAYLMDGMMRDVTIYGTAAKASVQLKRRDLAGKTGTTNDYIDAWFAGYQKTAVGVAWMGFDQPKRMGSGETGGNAALPIWIGTMSRALQGVPQETMSAPTGLARVSVTGSDGKDRQEMIYEENLPPPAPTPSIEAPPSPTS